MKKRHLLHGLRGILSLISLVGFVASATAQSTKSTFVASETNKEVQKGSLLVIGGGLLPNNTAIFGKLIEGAKVDGRTRIGILPTASKSQNGALRFAEQLVAHGLAAEQVQVLDLNEQNAEAYAESPSLVEQIRSCTGIYFTGGDQRRIVRALLKKDGTRTAALKAIDDVRDRGGIVAGSSAGAAAQSEAMISVSGLPDESIDDGMDAIDFGITKSLSEPGRRGLLVTPGLGLFQGGIIDQHFNQRRGRLARLARAAIEEGHRFGFGVDENTALTVDANGVMEVVGPGCVTIVDALNSKCIDGPLGCRINAVHLSCLEHGDRFDPASGQISVHPDKLLLMPGKEGYNGNFVIPDIAGRGALIGAIFSGLGHNTSPTQIGLTFKHYQHHAHGYRFTFAKTDRTQVFDGNIDGLTASSVIHIRLDIEPISIDLQPPESTMPKDIPQGPSRRMIESILFRGIMLNDDKHCFRPDAAITRRELAGAIAQSIRLEPPRLKQDSIEDVSKEDLFASDINLVIGAGLMDLENGHFHPDRLVSKQQVVSIFDLLAERYSGANQFSKSIGLADEAERVVEPSKSITREETAHALYHLLGFPW